MTVEIVGGSNADLAELVATQKLEQRYQVQVRALQCIHGDGNIADLREKVLITPLA